MPTHLHLCSVLERISGVNKPLVVLDAPSNPGLLARLAARDGGVVTPSRYLPDWDGKTLRNASALTTYSQRQGYWIHLDADVLDPVLMPAVDTPTPGGLTFQELTHLLQILISTNLAVGLEVTVFDPDLDPDGSLAQHLADVIVEALK
jgi:arginase